MHYYGRCRDDTRIYAPKKTRHSKLKIKLMLTHFIRSLWDHYERSVQNYGFCHSWYLDLILHWSFETIWTKCWLSNHNLLVCWISMWWYVHPINHPTNRMLLNNREVKEREMAETVNISTGSVSFQYRPGTTRINNSKRYLSLSTTQFLRRYVTMNETWIHHYSPVDKKHSAVDRTRRKASKAC